jgi:hypothetical protein
MNYPKTVDEILSGASNRATIERLRAQIKSEIPQATETVRRGVLTYMINGKKSLKILPYTDHVDLGFVNGTSLASPILKRRGRANNWRHVELKSPDDVSNPEVIRLLKRSAQLFLFVHT